MELWDLYDKNRQFINKTHIRGDKLNDGEYHIVVSIWTMSSDGHILITLRDPRKEDYPLKWENTAGSAISGESSLQAAKRELKEETGIIIHEDEIILVDSNIEKTAFIGTYFVRKEKETTCIILQDMETVDYKWITFDTLIEMINDETIAKPVGDRIMPYINKLKDFLLNK
jgi:isopentenyldiphosphate isomerase